MFRRTKCSRGEENNRYRDFVGKIAQEVGCFDFKPDQIVWHYTNGDGFLGILQSSRLYATQVAALNDADEITHASDLFTKAVKQLIVERIPEQHVVTFLNTLVEVYGACTGSHNVVSKFLVTSFSGEEDDLTQWDRYGKPNGYAIGFYARGLRREPMSTLYRVVYDSEKQEKAARELSEATVRFYLDGLNHERASNPGLWTQEFLTAWGEWLYKLAPLAKASKWKAENEYRIVHELKPAELSAVRFAQKATMLARYVALDTPSWVTRRSPLLPIAKIVIGPAPTSFRPKLAFGCCFTANGIFRTSRCGNGLLPPATVKRPSRTVLCTQSCVSCRVFQSGAPHAFKTVAGP